MSTSNSLKACLAIALISSGIAVDADTLAKITYGGPTQSYAVCYLYNAGTGPVNLTTKAIYSEGGSALTINNSSCGATLAAGSSCGFSALVMPGATACHAVVSPSAADVRGEMQIRNSSNGVLVSGDLR